jgi:hypothetical protein
MPDKREECGCHRLCPYERHSYERHCVWPKCLTPEEDAEFAAQLKREFEENGW